VSHYKAFIQTTAALQAVHEELAAVSVHLDSLLEDMPALTQSCDDFIAGSAAFVSRRAQNKQLQGASCWFFFVLGRRGWVWHSRA
jgi:Dor1-like family